MGSQGLYLKHRSTKLFELKFRCRFDSVGHYIHIDIVSRSSIRRPGYFQIEWFKTVITRLLRNMNKSIMGKLFIQTLDSPRIRIMMDYEY